MVFENDETSMFRAVDRNRKEIAKLRQTVTVLAICLLAAIALIIFLLMWISF